MSAPLDGNAIVYCRGAFATPNGKTAHGLVRKTRRYFVTSVVDPDRAGQDARAMLDGRPSGVPIVASIPEAIEHARSIGKPATHLVIGLAPDGGRLPPHARADVRIAIEAGLNVDSGLHDYLSEDADLAALARQRGVTIRDIRRTPPRDELHSFAGKIEEVEALTIAVLGTDSAVGKRTTSWLISDAMEAAGRKSVMVGTGQTAWLQGARFGVLMDALINDFVAGEIEHAVWSAWQAERPDVIVIEGQGSLMNPAYPGGLEILAAGRPDCIVLQHSPTRIEYDGFPGYALHPLDVQIKALELVSGRPVAAITLNHEGLAGDLIDAACASIRKETGLPCWDVLRDGADELASFLWNKHRGRDAA